MFANLMSLYCTASFAAAQGLSRKGIGHWGRHGLTYPYNIVNQPMGGVGEMLNNNEQTIFLKRKGFIKLALETGVDLIPHYTFGDCLDPPPYWPRFRQSSEFPS
jgi:hypothetical protein